MILRVASLLLAAWACPVRAAESGKLRAGAAVVDITPNWFPVHVNGSMFARQTDKVTDRLHARALALDNGRFALVLCVVDSCMMPRELIDAAKAKASHATGIPPAQMLVSATHTHSAVSAMGCLGAEPEERYIPFLIDKIAESIGEAAKRRVPARIGHAAVDAWSLTHTRRWIRRPDRMIMDPFGKVSVRANMHPGYVSGEVTGPSGPSDPELSLLSVQTRDGQPLALFANFSQHYKSAPALSADYAGRFSEGIGALIGAGSGFVGIMSQGTSGDTMWMDYSQPMKEISLEQYSADLMRVAADAYRTIEYRDEIALGMAEEKLKLRRRVPNQARLEWAKAVIAGLGERTVARDRPEVYAREQLFLAAEPERELVVQALRIGEVGITALPNEVFALTGLKLKAFSPLRPTFNISLANGADGYIPPPEQHRLGGYTTWPARTAGLEEQAEPRLVELLVGLLERVAGRPRRGANHEPGTYTQAILKSKPVAYWRLDEMSPSGVLVDSSGQGAMASYAGGVAVALPGVQSRFAMDAVAAAPEKSGPFSPQAINRSPHLAGGLIQVERPRLGATYSVEMWIWNGLPEGVRAVTGHLFAHGEGTEQIPDEILGITGKRDDLPGRIFYRARAAGESNAIGSTPLRLGRWYHVALVRDRNRVTAFLDGKPEFSVPAAPLSSKSERVLVGGHPNNDANFEGRVDEVALYHRTLSAAEVEAHFRASGRTAEN